MNEGEYLVLVNELRDQYNAMKEKYEIELNSLKQELEFIKEPYKFQYNFSTFFDLIFLIFRSYQL